VPTWIPVPSEEPVDKFTVPVPAIEEMELVAFIDISPSATTDIEPF
jgi:hypothetical protein